jgi:hypothetical protein
MQKIKNECNFFSINEKKKIINLFYNDLDSKTVESCLELYKDYIIQIWLKIDTYDFKKHINILRKIGFNPYIFGIYNRSMYIITRNKVKTIDLLKIFTKYYKNSIVQKNVIIFSEKRTNILKKLTELPNEVSGTISYDIIFVNNEKNNWKYINGDTKDNNGNEDSVIINYNKITYHTHPIPTYYKKGVQTYAWPSLQDYITVYDIGQYRGEIIYHLVMTREGIYLIIYDPKDNKINKDWIEKNMDISYDTISMSKFLERVNKNDIKTYFKKWGKEMRFVY